VPWKFPVVATSQPASVNCADARAARPVIRESFSTSSAGSAWAGGDAVVLVGEPGVDGGTDVDSEVDGGGEVVRLGPVADGEIEFDAEGLGDFEVGADCRAGSPRWCSA